MTEPEDADFAEALADLKARRDDRITELRGEGHSAREIARRLGITHPTVTRVLTGEGADDAPATTARQTSAEMDSWLRRAGGRTPPPAGELDLNEWVRSRGSARRKSSAVADRMRQLGVPISGGDTA